MKSDEFQGKERHVGLVLEGANTENICALFSAPAPSHFSLDAILSRPHVKQISIPKQEQKTIKE